MKCHEHDMMAYALIPQVRSNPCAQQVYVNEDKPDIDHCNESEWQIVCMRNGVEEWRVPGRRLMRSILHCAEAKLGELEVPP